MAKDNQQPDPTTAPEVNPEHVDLDLEPGDANSSEIDKSQTIAEAEAGSTNTPAEDESIYRQAANEVGAPEPVTKPKKKRGKKKLLLLFLALIFIGGGAAAAWYFVLRKKPTISSTPAPAAVQEEQKTMIGFEPDVVAYAFRESDTQPFTLFTRPTAGGDRTQVQVLNKGEELYHSDTVGQTAAFATINKLYVSVDGGRSYKSVLELEAGEEFTSIKISQEASHIAFATVTGNADKNIVRYVNTNGEQMTEAFTVNKSGVFLEAWSEEKGKAIYAEGCFGCDGGGYLLRSVNLADKKVSNLLSDVDSNTIQAAAVSHDMSKLVFSQATVDESGDGLGIAFVAPYKIQVLDISSGDISELATVGEAGEKNPNGTIKIRNVIVGFLAGTNTPFYTDDSALFVGESSTAAYESDSKIFKVLFVSENSVILSTGEQEVDYSLVNFDRTSKETANILAGDGNTSLIGISTK